MDGGCGNSGFVEEREVRAKSVFVEVVRMTQDRCDI